MNKLRHCHHMYSNNGNNKWSK